jgi:L-asparaginase
MTELCIIDTGGTFNKRYDEIVGQLAVESSGAAAKELVRLFRGNINVNIKPILHKDSLDIDDDDRKLLVKTVLESAAENVIIIHGTDTMDKSALELSEANSGKRVVFVASMCPFSIDEKEATANFFLAVGFLQASPKSGVYIAMHGLVSPHNEIKKDRLEGVFRRN